MKDEKWLRACESMAQIFSTCDKRKYAAFVLAPNGRVVGFGYNGSPPGHPHCDQGACPRLHQNSPHGSSYDNCIANHAESNALIWSDINTRQEGTLIVNGPPCYGCSKLIASSGVRRLVHYIDPAYKQWSDCVDILLSSEIEIISVVKPEETFYPNFNKTEAFPPQWTQKTCDIDDWESSMSNMIYRGTLPNHPDFP